MKLKEEINKMRSERRKLNPEKYREKDKQRYNRDKERINTRNKGYYIKNRDKRLENQKEYANSNKDKIRLYKKKYRVENREFLKKTGHNYYINNIDEFKNKHKKYRELNRDKNNTKKRNRFNNDIQFRLRETLRNSVNKAFTKYCEHKKIRSSELYGINFKEIITKLIETLPKDYERGKYHIDHIMPISRFDLTNPDEVRVCFSKDNIQWLPALENIRKSNKIMIGGVLCRK